MNRQSQSATKSAPFWITLGALALNAAGAIVLAVDRTQASGAGLVMFIIALVLLVIVLFLIGRSTDQIGVSLPNGPAEIDYADKGVKVNVPWQGYPVQIERIPSAPLEETRSRTDEFTPTEILLNVIVGRHDNLDSLVTHYNPRLELRMAFSLEALTRAKQQGLSYPHFGFWDGCKWVLFTEEKHKLAYEDNPNPTTEVAGHAVVQLTAWSDPFIGKGP